MSTQPLQSILQEFSTATFKQRIPFGKALGLAERQLIVAELERSRYDHCRTAANLNMTCATLRNRLKQYGIPGSKDQRNPSASAHPANVRQEREA
jgi:DNA-binding NtrC family response regulator